MSANSPFGIVKQGWIGVPVQWLSVTAWTTLPIYESDGVTVLTDGTPLDVSLWWFRLRVKRSLLDPDSAAIFAPPDWQIASGAGTSGAVPVPEMPATLTATLKPGTLFWDIKTIKAGATEPIAFLAGTINMGNTVGTDLFSIP